MFVFSAAIFPLFAFSATHYVTTTGDDATAEADNPDAPYATLVAAIDAAAANDTILVAPGTYFFAATANITKKLTILGSDDPYETIIDGSKVAKKAFSITNGGANGTLLAGFTIQNCIEGSGAAAAIFMNGTSSTVSNCVVRWNGNRSTVVFHAPIKVGSGAALFSHCTIVSNWFYSQASQNSAAISLASGTIRNCLIADNIVRNGNGRAGGVFLAGTAYNCTIVRNGDPLCGGVYRGASGSLYNCIVWDNYSTVGNSVKNYNDASSRWYNCCTYPGTDLIAAGASNIITTNPNILYDKPDYPIGPGSSCIDAGRTNGISSQISTVDISRKERIIDGDEDGDAIIDIGAFEYVPSDALACLINADTLAVYLPEGEEETTVTLFATVSGKNQEGLTYYWDLDGDGEYDDAVITDSNSVEVTLGFGSHSFGLKVTNSAADPADVETAYASAPNLVSVGATVLFVDCNSATPTEPYYKRSFAARTINDALSAAPPSGATIYVAPGTYNETLSISKVLSLIGEGGRDVTIISGAGINGRSVISVSPAGVLIRGFTIRDGANAYAYGQNVYLQTSSTVEDCRITACKRNDAHGGGIAMIDGGKLINSIVDNNRVSGTQGPAGVLAQGGSKIINCLIVNNVAQHSTTAVNNGNMRAGGVSLGSDSSMINCTVVSNGWSRGAGNTLQGYVYNSIIADNYNCDSAGNFLMASNAQSIVYSRLKNSLFSEYCGKTTESLAALGAAGCIIASPDFLYTRQSFDTDDFAPSYYAFPANSPAHNAADISLYNAALYGERDLIGNARVDRLPPKGKLDIGAIELPYISRSTLFLLR